MYIIPHANLSTLKSLNLTMSCWLVKQSFIYRSEVLNREFRAKSVITNSSNGHEVRARPPHANLSSYVGKLH